MFLHIFHEFRKPADHSVEGTVGEKDDKGRFGKRIIFQEILQFLVGGKGMARLSLVLDPLNHIGRIDPFIRRDFFRPVDGTEQADISNGKSIGKAVLKNIGDGGVTARFETGNNLRPDQRARKDSRAPAMAVG